MSSQHWTLLSGCSPRPASKFRAEGRPASAMSAQDLNEHTLKAKSSMKTAIRLVPAEMSESRSANRRLLRTAAATQGA